MSWRVSHAIDSLTREVDSAFPGRSKISDGTIGDAAHASRPSDHNPEGGIVHARDFTEWDPNKNIANDDVAFMLAEFLRAKKDPRTKYVISRGRMFSSYNTATRKAWEWGPYHGPNGHFHHCHVSVYGDDGSPWGFNKKIAQSFELPWKTFNKGHTDSYVRKAGGQDAEVTQYQSFLLWISARFNLPDLNPGKVDGINGPKSQAAWIAFQKWVVGMQRAFKQAVWPPPYDTKVTQYKMDVLRFWATGK